MQEFTIFDINWISREFEAKPLWFQFDSGGGHKFDIAYWNKDENKFAELRFDSEFPNNLDNGLWTKLVIEPSDLFTFDVNDQRAFDKGWWNVGSLGVNDKNVFSYDLAQNHRIDVEVWGDERIMAELNYEQGIIERLKQMNQHDNYRMYFDVIVTLPDDEVFISVKFDFTDFPKEKLTKNVIDGFEKCQFQTLNPTVRTYKGQVCILCDSPTKTITLPQTLKVTTINNTTKVFNIVCTTPEYDQCDLELGNTFDITLQDGMNGTLNYHSFTDNIITYNTKFLTSQGIDVVDTVDHNEYWVDGNCNKPKSYYRNLNGYNVNIPITLYLSNGEFGMNKIQKIQVNGNCPTQTMQSLELTNPHDCNFVSVAGSDNTQQHSKMYKIEIVFSEHF